MLALTLSRGPLPILLFPASPSAASASFPCTLTVASPDHVRAGGLVAIWQIALQRHDVWPPTTVTARKKGEWETLKTIVIVLREGDFAISPNEEQTYSFTFSLSNDLPRCRSTPWERIAHTLNIFLLTPSPAYSVVPLLRAASPVPSPASCRSSSDSGSSARRGLFSNFHRGSADAKASPAATTEQPRSQSSTLAGPHADPPPLPDLESPWIAEIHEELNVIATPEQMGQVCELHVAKTFDVEGLGRIRLFANSDCFNIGSAFFNCISFTSLNPLATIHAYHVVLEQRLHSADERTVHVDHWVIHRQGRSYLLSPHGKPPERDFLWRGEGARSLDRAAGAAKGKSKRNLNDDEPVPGPTTAMHLTCGPRVPSSACGGRPTLDRPEPSFSWTNHSLQFQIFWSLYGMSLADKPLPPHTEGEMRVSTVSVPVTVGGCAFSMTNVVAPGYSATAAATPALGRAAEPTPQASIEGCMEPFERGSEPRPFHALPKSWVERDGERWDLTNAQAHGSKSDHVRQHQLETDAQCTCFYEDAHPSFARDYRHIPTAEGETLDWAVLKPTPGGEKLMAAEKERVIDRWWKAHGGQRKAVPGFIHFLFDECPCEAARRSSVGNEAAERDGLKTS